MLGNRFDQPLKQNEMVAIELSPQQASGNVLHLAIVPRTDVRIYVYLQFAVAVHLTAVFRNDHKQHRKNK
jgi:hypothetical protein